MKKKTLIHFSIFLPLTLLFMGLSVLGFVNINDLGEKYDILDAECYEVSTSQMPLQNRVDANNDIINDPGLIYYCPICENFYYDTIDSTLHDDGQTKKPYPGTCPTCSNYKTGDIKNVIDSSTKKGDLSAENSVLLAQIAEIEVRSNVLNDQLDKTSSDLNKYMSLSIISSPIAVVLLLILVFARKE